jgi:hypothetical protein
MLPEQGFDRGVHRAEAALRPLSRSRDVVMRQEIKRSLVAVMVFALAGCEGPDGPAGPEGPTGATGEQGTTGASGPKGATAAAPEGGTSLLPDAGVAIQTSCLSPCHGFNGVVAQFETSGHYVEYVSNEVSATPEAEWTTPGVACGNCHAIDGLAQRVAGNVGTVSAGVVTNLASSELEYAAAGTVDDALYTGSATIAEVYCTTCHAVTDANDPHRTGIPWTPGSFPFVVPVDADAGAFIEKSASVGVVTGTTAGALGAANTCVWCHKSRKDVTQYITPTGNVISEYWGPHEGPQADIFSAKGGYEYPGETYGTSTHQLELSCTDCHMAPVADNKNVGDHSFEPTLSVCLGCHAAATSFDVNGGETLDQTEMFEFEADLNKAGYLTRSTAAPYGPLTAANLADGMFSSDSARTSDPDGGTPVTLDASQAGALYNYFLIAKGGGNGVHNPTYTQQLIYDSIVALTGKPPISLPVRPV